MPVIVKPISATFTRDTDFMATMDPYCKILIGQQMQRTRTCNNGGKTPTWTDTLQFIGMDPVLRLQAWDQDVTSDDLIGQGSFNLGSIYNLPPNLANNVYVDITYQGKSAGRVLLSIMHTGGANMGGNMGGGWGNMAGNQGWNQPQNTGWNQPQTGWNNQPKNNGWGNQSPNNGWGNQPQNNGWNQPPPTWGVQPMGTNLPQTGQNNWNNQGNNGWGNNQGNNGWGNNQGW